jgi:Protein of unknown function with HXXEE motif
MARSVPTPPARPAGLGPAILVGLVVAASIPLMLQRLGGTVTFIIGGSAVLAYGAWLGTTFRQPADPGQVVPPFLLLIAAELVHMGEEYLTDFPGEIRELFGAPVSFDLETFTVGLLIGVNVLALLAAAGLRRGNPAANYMVWFYVLGPGLANAVAHIYFPIAADRTYFPGLVTVALPTVFGLVVLARLLRPATPAHVRFP